MVISQSDAKGDFMVKTSWPFVEWTETIGKEDVNRLNVKEVVMMGDDVVGNMGALTRVEIFSSLFKPNTLFIKGKKARGIVAENREAEYFYYALFEDVHTGEKLKLEVTIGGKSTERTLREDGYYSNFAWDSPHIQRIMFPKGWKILSAVPNGYVLETIRELPSVKWDRKSGFRGDVQVKVEKA
jgi:hypothetical protein